MLQSNTQFLIDDSLVINVDHISVPSGGSRRTFIGKSSTDFYRIHRKSLYLPKLRRDDGEICLPVALVVAMAFADGVQGINRYNFLTYEPNHPDLIQKAKDLAVAAGVDYTNGCGIDEIRIFQRYLNSDYSLTVYNMANQYILNQIHRETVASIYY